MSMRTFVVLVVLSGACGPVASGTGVSERSAPVFEAGTCWFASPQGVVARCGTVSVPESRGRRAGPARTVRLAVARFSKTGGRARDPLFFLSGGPGGAAIDPAVRLFTPAFSSFLDHRDLIVVDQRGTGRSEPSLDCPVRDLAACRARLVRSGIDLGAYTTAENAADIDAVRQALGYERIDLLGGSYGTLLAQAVMRDYPTTVRSAILDSPAPLQQRVQLELIAHFEASLRVLFDACQADAACGRAYPNLRATFYDLVARLATTPIRVPGADSAAGPSGHVTLDGGRFGFLIWQSLYYSEAIPHLPRIVSDTASGHYERLARLIERTRLPDETSEGMQQSVECAEMAPFMEPGPLRDAARTIAPAMRQAALDEFGDVFDRCRIWNVPAASPRAKEALRSATPVLLLSGAFDPVTPPASARRTAETLTRHFLFVFPDSGHGVFRTSACARDVVSAFLADPEVSPRVPCLAHLAGPVFTLPDNGDRRDPPSAASTP
jgi:pimeloyl-ACP methyl ester carboxylesterase